MSVQLVDNTHSYECCVCWDVKVALWDDLAKEGWKRHYAGHGVEAIVLCEGCSAHIADRREAHLKAIESERTVE